MLGAVTFLLGGGAAPAGSATGIGLLVGNDAPSWSPDGRSIAFTSFRNGKGDIYLMSTDGTGQRRLTTSSAHDDLAAWSPDGTRIAFISDRAGNPEIYVMNADGSAQTRLTNDPGRDFSATWSPDGRRIAFRSDRDGNAEIYAMNADGTGLTRLTEDAATDNSPTWGRDGRIAFVSTRGTGAKSSIWLMNADGSGQRRLTPSTFFWNELRPAWSPDGKRVAFQADRDFPVGNTEIYLVNADGSGLTRLTTYPGKDDFPAWSPDGSRIAFSRGPAPTTPEIYAMSPTGSDLRQLTLPELEAFGYYKVPKRPVAGRRFTVTLLAAEQSGANLGRLTLSCRARIAAKVLPLASKTFQEGSGRARCSWPIPASAHGKLLLGSIAVSSRSAELSRTFSLRVG